MQLEISCADCAFIEATVRYVRHYTLKWWRLKISCCSMLSLIYENRLLIDRVESQNQFWESLRRFAFEFGFSVSQRSTSFFRTPYFLNLWIHFVALFRWDFFDEINLLNRYRVENLPCIFKYLHLVESFFHIAQMRASYRYELLLNAWIPFS